MNLSKISVFQHASINSKREKDAGLCEAARIAVANGYGELERRRRGGAGRELRRGVAENCGVLVPLDIRSDLTAKVNR